MYDYDIKDKTYAGVKKRKFPYFSVGLIIVGTAMLIGGGIWYANTDMSRYEDNMISSVSDELDGSKVENVKITASASEIRVGTSEDGLVHLEGNVPDGYTFNEHNGTLNIDLTLDHVNFMNLNDDDKEPVFIYLPDRMYEDFELNIGAGEITIDNISCKNAKLETGAGEIIVTNVKCENKLISDTGTGEIEISESVVGGLKANIGAGEFTYNGEVNGDIDVDCGVGECSIDLTNTKEEFDKKYKVDIDTGIGDVNVTYGN
ncbi:DUF4097 family beta strand repeat-containing protein [uncultured Ruminococcus sp.]|uniref:DUF4097 family beta strand repeat-containing protein n=1 Tax=uncultured Ruminococcus sp. TaxID=165186 RepID=UPI0025FA04A9|nr:DUF4097 family beta strand repeat-containing protein [uncultured Ruminococcus sp.]